MIPFLIGAVAFLAARVVLHGRWKASVGSWAMAAMAALCLGQLWLSSTRFEGYRLEVLGARFSAGDPAGAEPSGEPLTRSWSVSGDREASDLFVPGLGDEPVASLTVGHDRAEVSSTGQGRGLVLARSPGARSWSLLHSVPLVSGDTITLRDSGGQVDTLVYRSARSGLGAWVLGTDDRLVYGGVEVALNYPRGSGFFGLFRRRPNVFQRAYPLGDVVRVADVDTPFGSLHSFVYYDAGTPRLAMLDDGVSVLSALGSKVPARTGVLWEDDRPGRVLLAALPLRDFPEDGLTLPERYGVRALRSYTFSLEDGWLTAMRSRGEIHLMKASDLVLSNDPWQERSYQVRVAVGDGERRGATVMLQSFSDRFRTAGEAILRLPEDATSGVFSVTSPSGFASWTTGRPFTLEDGERGALIRIDGMGMSLAFGGFLAGIFLVGALAFGLFKVAPSIAALTILVSGVVSIRLLLSLSAMARFPFVGEGHQISLWMIAGLPWVLLGLGSLFPSHKSEQRDEPGTALVPRGFQGGYMGAPLVDSPPAQGEERGPGGWALEICLWGGLLFFAGALFPTGLAKAAALGGLVVGLLLLRVFLLVSTGGSWFGRGASGGGGKLRGTLTALPLRLSHALSGAPWPGLIIGLSLFALRLVLEAVGFREQVSFAGVRIGLSVFYTPLSFLAFGGVLLLHDLRLRRMHTRALAVRAFTRGLIDLVSLLACGFAIVGLWISDFGIVLTTLPGPLLVLTAWGWYWSRRMGVGAGLAGALPLAVFAALQASPEMILVGTDVQSEDGSPVSGWSRNELLLLERGDSDALDLIGESRSEALAVMRETMRSYTRGNLMGRGFLEGRVSPEIRATATREHVVSGLLASQWGLPGVLGLSMLLLGFVGLGLRSLAAWAGATMPSRRASQTPPSKDSKGQGTVVTLLFVALVVPGLVLPVVPAAVLTALAVSIVAVAILSAAFGRSGQGFRPLWHLDVEPDWVSRVESPTVVLRSALETMAGVLLIGFGAAGIYMVLANYGLVLFTGKNVYLLGLDSLGDALESFAILGLSVVGYGVARWKTREVSEGTEVVLASSPGADAKWRRVG